MEKPVIRVIEGPSATAEGVSQSSVLGVASVLSAASKAAELFPHDVDGLVQILHFRNAVAEAARRRAWWIGGRIYNKFSGEDPEYIPLSGSHLRQTLGAVGVAPPDLIVASGRYQLRLDISQNAVRRLLEAREE